MKIVTIYEATTSKNSLTDKSISNFMHLNKSIFSMFLCLNKSISNLSKSFITKLLSTLRIGAICRQ